VAAAVAALVALVAAVRVETLTLRVFLLMPTALVVVVQAA
jgi:hypothetical protein